MGQVATILSVLAALFVGFLQLSGWFLIPLAAFAVFGMRYYHPDQFITWWSYVRSFVIALLIIALFEWIARLASLYMTGHQFTGAVG